MKAVVFEEFGEPADVLQCRDVPVPEPGPGEVRVRMLASPINPSDLMTVRGIYGKKPELPATPGYEGVGVVEASGGGMMGKLLTGKRVAVPNRRTGNWCEHTVIPAKQAIPVSSKLPLEQVAMFFVNPATAYVMTREVLKVPPGDWLLQTAAGSSLGRMVIRLGQHYGFRTLNVVRREEQVTELNALGADAVVVFDEEKHTRDDFKREVMRVTQDDGVKYALDCVGGETGSAVVGSLGEDAQLLVYGTLDDQPLSFSSRELMSVGSRVEGFWLSRWMQNIGLIGKLGLVRKISKLMQQRILVSEVKESYSLDQISAAVVAAEEPGRGGKILLKMSPDG